MLVVSLVGLVLLYCFKVVTKVLPKTIKLMKKEKPTLLLVDDERLYINILNKMIKDSYEIKVALNGRQAFERAISTPHPDLILLDVQMPELDGFKVLTRLQNDTRTSGIPVIFITAMNSEDDETRGFELGAVDYITKPFSPAIVNARIKIHLELLRQKCELKEMHQQVLALSITDALTGIANRRRFDEFLEQEWTRSSRVESSLGLLMMDIDYFKLYNDHYGHNGGDKCLKQIAEILIKEVIRSPDMLARYGGEEFACVLPGVNLEELHEIAQAILETIRTAAIPHEKSDVTGIVTLSIGGTVIKPNLNTGNCEELINMADRLLYESKQKGRNRMTINSMSSTIKNQQ
jgi:diguanylate cyclase (GGDEF)-like protein